ncbi:MAG: PilZ domain-containing protein [Proteobacteria bacterium]|nr:PilZ domain-containing protein [Pseudomonadota bacterium]
MSGTEKRKAKRREIVDQFSFYVCVPKLGYTRHKVKDISEIGIGFEIETLGEFKLQKGEVCELQFYLNQSLHLSLQIEVMRQIDHEATQEVGASFVDQKSNAHATFSTLVKLVDQLSEFAETTPA